MVMVNVGPTWIPWDIDFVGYRLSFHMEVGAILKRLFSQNRSSSWCGQQMKPVYCNVKNSMSGFLITCN